MRACLSRTSFTDLLVKRSKSKNCWRLFADLWSTSPFLAIFSQLRQQMGLLQLIRQVGLRRPSPLPAREPAGRPLLVTLPLTSVSIFTCAGADSKAAQAQRPQRQLVRRGGPLSPSCHCISTDILEMLNKERVCRTCSARFPWNILQSQ